MNDKIIYKVSFTCPPLSGVGSSQTFNLISLWDNEDLSCIPVLKSISQVGAEVNELSPTDARADILVNNTWQSFGSERRFSDMLDGCAFINQPISIYVSKTSALASNSFNLIWSGRIAAINTNYDRETISISVIRTGIGNQILTQEVTTDNYPSAPPQSLGQVVPLVLGYNQQVRPLLVDVNIDSEIADWSIGKYDGIFAYGTNFANQYQNAGIQKILVRGNDNYYRRVTSASNFGGWGNQIAHQILPPNNSDASDQYLFYSRTSWAAKQSGWQFYTETYGCAVTGFEVYFFVHNTGTYSVALTLWNDNKGYPGNQIASVVRKSTDAVTIGTKTDQTDSATRTLISHRFVFDKPVVFAASEKFYFTLSITDDTASTPIKVAASGDHAASYSRIEYWDDDVRKQVWAYTSANRRADCITIYGLDFYDANKGAWELFSSIDGEVDSNGFGSSKIIVSYGTDDNDFDFNDLGIIVETHGLAENESGTLSEPRRLPTGVSDIIFRKWDGDSWELENFDEDAYSDSHTVFSDSDGAFYRILSGNYPTRVTCKQVCDDIARNSMGKFAPVFGQPENIGYYAYGAQLSPSFELTDDDCKILSLKVEGTESIINHALVLYFPQSLASDKSFLGSGYMRNFDSDSLSSKQRDISRSTYGLCELANNRFNLIGNVGISGQTIASCLIGRYSQPTVFIEAELPIEKILGLNLLEVGYISSPQLPSFWGSSAAAKFPDGTLPMTYDYFRRATRHKVQIEGFNIALEPNSISGRLKFRLIYGGDLT